MADQDPLTVEIGHSAGVYTLRGLTIVRGQGGRVWDDRGRAYIDCIAGHGAAILGHAHPAVARALADQAGRLISCPGTFANDVRAALLARLARVTGFPRFFLCNSGAEAVEAAAKFARLATGRPGFVAAMRGFHGRTVGALSLTWEPKYRRPFEPLMPEVTHVPFNDLEAAAHAVSEQTAAIIVEPVQGEGGRAPGLPELFGRPEGPV
ncbi:MAG: aminotransferase class III-fold pyridoxal phosphate-dependent enzyme [Ardenticatenia bacterium]|nr:aminotransferase class III-fold pyridoxal phosphate-dependent enzyme [Ardenticatenia bacterium]